MLGKFDLRLSGIALVNSYSEIPIGLSIPFSAYSASGLLVPVCCKDSVLYYAQVIAVTMIVWWFVVCTTLAQ